MRVHSLYIYPVKSLAGIQVPCFSMNDFGPAEDRRWMLVDSNSRFVTQRGIPGLARVRTQLSPEGITVDIPGEGSFLLEATEVRSTVLVWRDEVVALEGCPGVNDAISRFCGQALKFVYMPETSFRRIDPERVADKRRVGFADGFPFLLTNLASLDELNERLAEPVAMRRFRPNIVIEGAPAWQEDNWSTLAIGSRAFNVVKPCSRCVVTTVDPDTGVKNPGTQPLKTLASFRKNADGVIFGQNALHDAPGSIAVGDPVLSLS